MTDPVKKRIVIHIGFPRCGSTLLQRYIFPQLEPRVKIISPASKDRRLIDFLIERFIFSGRNIYLEPVTAEERAYVDTILREYPQSIVLISNEGLIGDVFDNSLNSVHLVGAMRELFHDAEVLLVIRRQSEIVKSFYRHAVEDGYYRSFPAFVRFRAGRFDGFRLTRFLGLNVDPHALNFYNAFKFFENAFGSGKVHVLPFEWIEKDFGRFCATLARHIGGEVPNAVRAAPIVNRGLQKADLALLRFLNRLWDTRVLGIQLLPHLDLVSRYEGGRRAGWTFHGICLRLLARFSPYYCYLLLGPVLSWPIGRIYSLLEMEELKDASAISAAIDAVTFDSNSRLNVALGGILSGLGYCDGSRMPSESAGREGEKC